LQEANKRKAQTIGYILLMTTKLCLIQL